MVRDRAAAGHDRRDRLEPVRDALPQPSLRAALPALRAARRQTPGKRERKRERKHEAKPHGAAVSEVERRRVHAFAPDRIDARARTGFGSDCPDFAPLLSDARRRHARLRTALADAGYDSEANHRIAREHLRVRSLIKAGVGRPSERPPSGYYSRIMSKRLRGSQKGKPYGQRAQAETVNSMLKRNLGEALRARTPKARRNEQLLRVLTHNIALLCDTIED